MPNSWRGQLIAVREKLFSCPTGKVKHSTRREAEAHMKQVASRFGEGDRHVYFHSQCGGYHIGERHIIPRLQ